MPEDGGGWKPVRTQAELEELLDIFGWFHDALIKEIHLLNGGYVDGEDLGMFTRPFSARVLVQRQFRNPSAIEIVFEGLQSLEIENPWEIFDGGSETAQAPGGGTLLVLTLDTAKFVFIELRYRDASEWMGPAARFAPEWR